MPTPSVPASQSPYNFTATCPDPEASTSSQHQHVTHIDTSDRSIRLNDTSSPDHDPASASSVASSTVGAIQRVGDGTGAEVEIASPSATPIGLFANAQKIADGGLEPSEFLYDYTLIKRIRPSSPRHGVGTPHLSSCHMDTDTGSETAQFAVEEDYDLPSMGRGFPNRRVIPTSPSSFLRAGSRFTGTQQSERQVYNVQVEIKYVDLRESFLCGYLKIQGLTDEHPTLTTYFEGEIIGTKYSFLTRHDAWGANDKTDLSHWAKFPAFRPYAKQARRGSSVVIKDVAQSEHIFMRWKEHFLVPDHRVRTITGASFEGFYYICFNQIAGEVHGIYYHSKSERFQQLELKHVEDRGCYSALEFR